MSELRPIILPSQPESKSTDAGYANNPILSTFKTDEKGNILPGGRKKSEKKKEYRYL